MDIILINNISNNIIYVINDELFKYLMAYFSIIFIYDYFFII